MAGRRTDHTYAFFCDESGISNDRFCVVGGLCLHKDTIGDVHRNIAAFRKEHGMHAELKWSKVSNQKIDQYKSLVDYFFAMNNSNLIHFHCVIFDNHRWRNGDFNNGDRDMGISKLYYQLLHHRFAKVCGSSESLFVCMDRRNSSTSLNDLRDMLNAASRRDFSHKGPFKEVISEDSKLDDLLQLNDVILGAVCAAKNGKHILPSTRQAKREIAELVLEKSGIGSYDVNTPKAQNRFTIWNFRAR